jgi:hypothetical protein
MKNKLFFFAFMTGLLVMVTGCAPGTFPQLNTPVPNTRAGTPVPNTQAGTPVPNGQITVPGVTIQIYNPGPNPLMNTTDAHGSVAGVLLGIWHGVISPVTLVISFFNKDVQMYEVHNDGSQYNLGFFLGIVILFVILGVISGSRRR